MSRHREERASAPLPNERLAALIAGDMQRLRERQAEAARMFPDACKPLVSAPVHDADAAAHKHFERHADLT